LFFLAGLKAQGAEGSGRILLGDKKKGAGRRSCCGHLGFSVQEFGFELHSPVYSRYVVDILCNKFRLAPGT